MRSSRSCKGRSTRPCRRSSGFPRDRAHAPWADPGDPGFLGLAHAPFTPNGADLANLTLKASASAGSTDRKGLLRSFDTLRRDIDATGALDGLDAFTRRAFDILTSSKLVERSTSPAKTPGSAPSTATAT